MPPQAVVDLPLEAHLPDDYVPEEAQKLELYRRLARARTAGDVAAFRQEVTDRFGPMPQPVLRLAEVAELRLAAEARGRRVDVPRGGPARRPLRRGPVARDRDAAAHAGGSLPGVRHADVTFASNQVRIRLPRDPLKGWQPDAGGRRPAVDGGIVSESESKRVLQLEIPIESDEELTALEGALIAARAAELSQIRRRGARHAFGYGSDSARETMTDEVDYAERRHAILDRVLAAVKEASASNSD